MKTQSKNHTGVNPDELQSRLDRSNVDVKV